MKSKYVLYFFVIVVVCLLSLWGCPKKTEVTTAPETQKEAAAQPVAQQTAPAAQTASERATAGSEGLKPVYFDFDKSFVRKDAEPTLQANAEWLKANPKAKVRIEGNCDERGTKEYNQALGQRRATSARKYLTDMGVSRSRISLISYGKEKPICGEQNETCWQKNRRDDFVVQK
jgi:peptidoglycan-associated lipoprotein